MSAATIKILADKIHQHPATPEECEATRLLLLTLCPSGRLNIPAHAEEPQGDLFNKARSLRENGWSIRRIARELKISKSRVHRELSQTQTSDGTEAEKNC